MGEKTHHIRVFEEDVDRLDALNRREESYAETFRRILDAHSHEIDAQRAN